MAEASKVVFGGETVVDLTQDTVSPETLLEGITAHNNKGEAIVGVYKEEENESGNNGSGAGNSDEISFDFQLQCDNDSTDTSCYGNVCIYFSALYARLKDKYRYVTLTNTSEYGFPRYTSLTGIINLFGSSFSYSGTQLSPGESLTCEMGVPLTIGDIYIQSRVNRAHHFTYDFNIAFHN